MSDAVTRKLLLRRVDDAIGADEPVAIVVITRGGARLIAPQGKRVRLAGETRGLGMVTVSIQEEDER